MGMGKDLTDRYKSSSEVFDQASEALGFDLRKMIFEGDEETLKITEYTQPAILTVSIAALKPLMESGIKAAVTAGLSLGEYSAHVYAQTMEFTDAVRLVRKRGKYMQEAVPKGKGAMAAIIGLENELVIECCNQAGAKGIVETVNFNCPGQLVVAGETAAVEEAVRLCTEKGAKRAVVLPVSAPFHSRMMKPAAERLKAELDKIVLSDAKVPVVANVNAEYVTDSRKISDLLVRQVYSPVLWEKSIRNMIAKGVDTFVEIGPGKALSGFVKRIDREVRVFNVENLASLDMTISAITA